MTTEELLKTRYKVVADYPGTHLKIGMVIPDNYRKNDFDSPNNYHLYPGIFKKLEWWEDRKPEEMPKYVRSGFDGKVHKAEKWLSDKHGRLYFLETDDSGWYAHAILPTISTKEEYQNQKTNQ